MRDQSRKKGTSKEEAPFSLTSSICCDIMQLSNKGKSSKAVSNSEKRIFNTSKKILSKKFQKYLTSAFILDIISVSSTFALDKIPVFKRASLKRGKKLSFVRRVRNGSRARLQRETRAERKAKPSRER